MRILLPALALFLVSLSGLLAFAHYRWRVKSSDFIARLIGDGPVSPPAGLSVLEFEGLPVSVMRYFRAVLRDGQRIVRCVRISQRGEFLLRPAPNGWRPFSAIEYFATRPPGFVWDARINMGPGLTVWVRDTFVDGTGCMLASLMGLIRKVSVVETPEIAAGALHHYLAETVWFPTSLLPSEGVAWTPLDDSSARATLSVGETTVSLDFRFGQDGLVQSVFTPARARLVNGRAVPTPWQGRFFDYEERGGMRIPLRGEVEWLLPDGPQVYWRGRITEIAYNFRE